MAERVAIIQCPVWNLWIQWPFQLDGYSFTPIEGYQDAIRRLIERPEDQLTVLVRKETTKGSPQELSLLLEGGRFMDDIMALLSLAHGRNVHYRELNWEIREGDTVVSQGKDYNYMGRALAQGERAISPFETEAFLSQALEILRQPGWPSDSLFTPAIFWYFESISANVPEVRFVSAWLGLRALALGHGNEKPFPLTAQSQGGQYGWERLARLGGAIHGWDFLSDPLVEAWEEIGNDYLVRAPKERVFTPRQAYIFTRKLQLSLLLMLLGMVGAGDFARRGSILRDINR